MLMQVLSALTALLTSESVSLQVQNWSKAKQLKLETQNFYIYFKLI